MELDEMFPTKGYEILDPPGDYVPIKTPLRRITATPTPFGQVRVCVCACVCVCV